VLLKIVLLAYSRGLISSRSIAGACRHNVLFMAVSGDRAPHFTTVAHFISTLGDEAQALFTQVLLVCDHLGLIGRELFAIDGVKLRAGSRPKPQSGSTASSGITENQSLTSRIPWNTVGRMRIQITEVYRDWINGLNDRTTRARIQVRVDRLAHGNPGQHRNLTDGVSELKIDVGPGYRVYYTERNGELIVLLAGGDKSSQAQDIKAAIALARNL
jgi:putative addiction module killer protein